VGHLRNAINTAAVIELFVSICAKYAGVSLSAVRNQYHDQMQYGPSPLSALADDVVDELLQCKATLVAIFGFGTMSDLRPLREVKRTSVQRAVKMRFEDPTASAAATLTG
jgi:hypothetical protein